LTAYNQGRYNHVIMRGGRQNHVKAIQTKEKMQKAIINHPPEETRQATQEIILGRGVKIWQAKKRKR